jgi:hypothetical protein
MSKKCQHLCEIARLFLSAFAGVGATASSSSLPSQPLLPLPASLVSKTRACQLLHGSVLSSVRKTAASDFDTYLSPGFDFNEQAINE